MRKKGKYLIFILAALLLVIPFVSADSYDLDRAKDAITKIIDTVLGILSPVFEQIIGDYSTSDFFFSKILLLIMLIVICKKVLDITPFGEDNKRVSLIISVIVSIIAIRFINENDFFEAIFIQYGTLGIAITTILPMVIFFYFIHNTKVGAYGRKVFWALYGITLGAIWIMKSSEIPEVANWIYGLTLLAAIIFIFFDKSIHSYFGLADLHKFISKQSKEGIYRAKERMIKLEERLDKKIISEWEYRKGIEEEERLIRELSKE